jgi:signal transduction histidine kinase
MTDGERNKILIVDDELPNLQSFKATFRRIYNVYTAQSAEEGFNILLEEPDICVVVSDHKMPVKTGVEFLEDLKNLYPEMIRIVLTGYADLESTRDAINKASVYRFLNKPWNEADLAGTLASAVELFQTRAQLKKNREELENAYAELSRFVYSASHDLRAPLVSVMGLIHLAKQDPAFPKDDAYMPLIEQSIMKLDVFVKNIVDYYQNKERSNKPTIVDIEAILNEVFEALEFYRQREGIKRETEIDIQSPIVCDEFRLRVILNNLVSNAIKYQRKDETNKKIFVTIKADADSLVISVEDNGIGIKAGSLNSLFEMFYRATNQESGSGIGLYIVKDAIHKLNGTVNVESEFGKGSKFTVMIPNQKEQ